MSRKNAAPTHGWVIGSQINKWLALIFFIIILICAATWLRISYAIDRDCNRPYERHLKLGGYWIDVNIGSRKKGCVQP